MSMERSAGAVIVSIHAPTIKDHKTGKIVLQKKPRREYLLLHYEAGHWDFPKGHLEGVEISEDAARREIREETGLIVSRFLPGFKHHLRYWMWAHSTQPKERPKRRLKIVTFFLATTATRNVRLSGEHSGYAWFNYHDAVKSATYPDAKNLLRKAESYFRAQENHRVGRQRSPRRHP